MEQNQLLERIVLTPKVMTGKPIIRGTRLTVQYILNLLAHGSTVDEILQEYKGLTKEDILACLSYASETLENKVKEKAEKAKIQNIIDMALSFSAMKRVFEKGSTEKITEKIGNCIKEFSNLNTKEKYYERHKELCEWFTRNIKTAERKKDRRIIKKSRYASWGQAAKVIDIVLKVCVYYCNLPSANVSSKIVTWLNGAIDTPILKYLKKHYNSPIISQISTLGDIDKVKYKELQKMIRIDIEESFNGEVFPVQYDDIRWRKLNR